MDAQQFLAEFGHTANAPGGVARLRELILHLAVSGDLVRTEGPVDASPLLGVIGQQKQGHPDKKRVISSQAPVSRGAIRAPSHWAVCRLGDIALTITGGGTPSKNHPAYWNGDILWASVKDMKNFKYLDGTEEHVTEDGLKNSSSNLIPPGRIIVCTRMGLGKVAINRVAMAINQDLKALELPAQVNSDFFLILYKTREVKGTGTTVAGIKQDQLLALPVALPPTEEQSRIVAKVDELMALCDQLEAQQQERRKLQNALRQSTLQALSSAQSPHELQDSWQRLQANFGRLFGEPGDVDTLRATVLDLAVTGFLSERSLNDESVDQFVFRSREAKAHRLASGEMKRKTAAATDVIQLDIAVPEHWTKVSLDELFQFIDYRGKTPTKTDSGVVLVTAKNVRPGQLHREPIEYISEKSYAEWMTRGFPKVGDLLFTTEAPLGNVALIEDLPNFALAQRIIDLQPFADLNTRCAMYFLLSPTFQDLLEKNSTGMTAKGIKAAKLKQLELPVPPVPEQARIVARVEQLMRFCGELEKQLRDAEKAAQRVATAAVAALTGITIEQEEEASVKAPQTELIAPLRLGTPPDVKAQAPLATLLVRHNGEMSARDLWQRFGGEIDAFYAQLKTEVAHGWIAEPAVAEVREKSSAAAGG